MLGNDDGNILFFFLVFDFFVVVFVEVGQVFEQFFVFVGGGVLVGDGSEMGCQFFDGVFVEFVLVRLQSVSLYDQIFEVDVRSLF